MEEARQHLGPVLRRDGLRERVEGRHAKPSVAQGLEHLRVSLDQLDRDLPVEGRALRHPELPDEEVVEIGIPRLRPPALPVEVREGGDEVREGSPLVREERGQTGDEGSGGLGHHGDHHRTPL
jgi:hypothetical protein